MWLTVVLPDFGPRASIGLVRYHVAVGDRVEPGAALIDLAIDLGGGVMRDCPPVSTCRIVAQEAAFVRWLREPAATGLRSGELLMKLSPFADAPPDDEARPARTAAAAIVDHAAWWDADD